MKYFKIGSLDYHCDDIFNYVATDKNGSVYLYENKPFMRWNYWTGGSMSQDLCVKQDCHFSSGWVNSLRGLTC